MTKEIVDLTDAVINQSDFTTTCCSPVKELTVEDVNKMHEMLSKYIMVQSVFKTPLRINRRISYGIKPTHGFGVIHFS